MKKKRILECHTTECPHCGGTGRIIHYDFPSRAVKGGISQDKKPEKNISKF